MANDIIEHDGGATPMNLVQQLTRAEIEQQIGTARQYPRRMTRVVQNMIDLATISAASAEKCTYTLPRGNKPITGPSIRMAEIIASQWGNCRTGARVVHVDKKEGFVEAEGVFHDLETNAATIKRVRRGILDRNGKVFSADMIIVTGNAACSIALRNAILGGVPEAAWGDAYEQAIITVRGDMKTLTERRTDAMKGMALFGLLPDQVYKVLGVSGEKDVGADHIVALRGIFQGIKSGETTVEELLAAAEEADTAPRSAGSITGGRTTRQQPAKAEPKADTGYPKGSEAERRANEEEAQYEAEKKKVKAEADAKAKADKEASDKKEAEGREALKKVEADQKAKADEQAELDAAEERHEKERKAKEVATETPHDPVTGEVLNDDEPTAPATNAPDHEAYMDLYDKILNKMMEGGDIEGTAKMYEAEIESMREHAPDVWKMLQDEMNEN